MSVPDERPARAAERPARNSFKGLFLVIAAPITLILLWILMLRLAPLFLG
jgi:hypothetical protein